MTRPSFGGGAVIRLDEISESEALRRSVVDRPLTRYQFVHARGEQ